jgi:hypothetical protein
LLVLLACAACNSSSPATNDASDDDAGASDADVLPEIDTTACPSVDASEAPMTFSPTYVALSSGSYVEDKGFYFVTILEGLPTVLADLLMDPTLSAASTSRDGAIRNASQTCAGDPTCVGNALAFSSADTTAIAQAISARLVSSGNLSVVVTNHMRPSGAFDAHASLDDASLVARAWTDSANWMNNAIAAYATELGATGTQTAIANVVTANPSPMPFFLPAMASVLAILDADNRDNAAIGEPLASGENAAVVANIPSIDFSKYPYTMLVVPGIGPTDATTMLSEGSQAHADMAADRFAAKWAPLFALTGGRVHPDRTTYAEALEMKNYLMTARGIPENVIVVDPFARHTTTNIRNVSRLAFRYGIPTNAHALIVSDFGQTITITGQQFLATCQSEMGLVPWRSVAMLSNDDACFVPSVIVMQQNGADPLDP